MPNQTLRPGTAHKSRRHIFNFVNDTWRQTLKRFHLNGHILGFHTQTQKLELYKLEVEISHVANKVAKSIGIISRCSFFLPKTSLRMLYYSLNYPYFYYCNIVWASTY